MLPLVDQMSTADTNMLSMSIEAHVGYTVSVRDSLRSLSPTAPAILKRPRGTVLCCICLMCRAVQSISSLVGLKLAGCQDVSEAVPGHGRVQRLAALLARRRLR